MWLQQTNKMGKVIQYAALALTGLMWLGGSAMLGLGIWVTTQETEYKHLSGNLYVTIGYIIISSFVFVVGFIGTCSILLLKGKLLKLYFALLLMLFLAELSVAIYFYLEKEKIEGHIQTNWNKTEDHTRILIQKKLQCCSMNPLITSHSSSSDKSCFKDEERLEDCYSKVKGWLQNNYMILATSAVAVAVVEMFVLGGTCRIIADLESGVQLVSQTRVVPYDDSKKSPKHRTGVAVKGASESSDTTDHEDGEIPLERRTQRKAWAKRDPKYDTVFSKT